MSVGDLRERVTVQYRAETADGQGGTSTVWTVLDSMWAELLPMRVTEKLTAATIGSHVTTLFRVRARHDVTAKMRLTWRPSWAPSGATVHTLEIHGVRPDDKEPRQWTVFECGEVV